MIGQNLQNIKNNYQETQLLHGSAEKQQDASVRSGRSNRNNNNYREEVPFEILV